MHGQSEYAYGLWPLVIWNILFVLVFVAEFLRPKTRVEWRSLGVLTAFLVALFTEMYGFPLTIYILTTLLGRAYPVADPFSHINGHLLVVLAGGAEGLWLAIDVGTSLLFLAGLVIMGRAWRQIHRAQGEVVTDGLYARVRHPQYVGLFLIIVSLLIQWPTLLTLPMAPVLLMMYYRLAQREERELIERFGERYRIYQAQVPAFVPRLWGAKPVSGASGEILELPTKV